MTSSPSRCQSCVWIAGPSVGFVVQRAVAEDGLGVGDHDPVAAEPFDDRLQLRGHAGAVVRAGTVTQTPRHLLCAVVETRRMVGEAAAESGGDAHPRRKPTGG